MGDFGLFKDVYYVQNYFEFLRQPMHFFFAINQNFTGQFKLNTGLLLQGHKRTAACKVKWVFERNVVEHRFYFVWLCDVY